MKLHENKELFLDVLLGAAERLQIAPAFIEKDYWITYCLKQATLSSDPERVVFKGGTSLTKVFGLGSRFSEDIDIAIAHADELSGNQLKMLLKRLSKSMTQGLPEIVEESLTSKGSRFHKMLHAYPSVLEAAGHEHVKIGRILVEISSFANPYPFDKETIQSLVYDFLSVSDAQDIIDTYDLAPFMMNVLDKRQTMLEKLVSLYRFSLAQHYQAEVGGKIRHFYDLHFLLQDEEIAQYVEKGELRAAFDDLWKHDQAQFDKPEGWCEKTIEDSPLVTDFESLWVAIKPLYNKGLREVAYAAIPDEKVVAESFLKIQKALLG